ncbi:MAG: hypothetical protein ABF690_13135 [Liquorilactobacillus nagelii]|uniref:hypothetical protein n=1 Tax=Lactobacillaceae TaxID=33958 RepID=UPI0039EA4BFF
MKFSGLDLINKLSYLNTSSETGIYETENITVHGKTVHVLKFVDGDEFEIKKEPVAADSSK